jgi:hypothetical protein
MQLHLDIKLASDGFPTAEETAKVEALAVSIRAFNLGPIVSRGAGRGHADIFLRIPAPKQEQALKEIRDLLDRGPFAGAYAIKVLSER